MRADTVCAVQSEYIVWRRSMEMREWNVGNDVGLTVR